MSISGVVQFIVGFMLGCVLLVGGTGTAAYFFLTRLSANPPKPIFAEEQKEKATTPETKDTQPVAATTEEKTPVEKPEEKVKPVEVKEKLEPGAYRAKVTWSTGLSLRAEPSIESERIGSVLYNQEIIILEESSDKQWQKIRFPNTKSTGWVKAGNIEKINETASTTEN